MARLRREPTTDAEAASNHGPNVPDSDLGLTTGFPDHTRNGTPSDDASDDHIESYQTQLDDQLIVGQETFVPESSLYRPEDVEAAEAINSAVFSLSNQKSRPHPQGSAQSPPRSGRLSKIPKFDPRRNDLAKIAREEQKYAPVTSLYDIPNSPESPKTATSSLRTPQPKRKITAEQTPPLKRQKVNDTPKTRSSRTVDLEPASSEEQPAMGNSKRRGRPPKIPVVGNQEPQKKRGRPRKYVKEANAKGHAPENRGNRAVEESNTINEETNESATPDQETAPSNTSGRTTRASEKQAETVASRTRSGQQEAQAVSSNTVPPKESSKNAGKLAVGSEDQQPASSTHPAPRQTAASDANAPSNQEVEVLENGDDDYGPEQAGQEEALEDEEQENCEAHPSVEPDFFHGLEPDLKKVFSAERYVGVRNVGVHRDRHKFKKCETKIGDHFVKLCKDATNKILQTEVAGDEDIRGQFNKVDKQLRVYQENHARNSENKSNLKQDAYTMVIPRLNDLLKAIYTTFKSETLASTDNADTLSFEQSTLVLDIAKKIINFEDQVRNWKDEPTTEFPVKRPIQHRAIAPLKIICARLHLALRDETKKRATASHKIDLAEQARRRREEEEEEETAARARNESYRFWAPLNQLRLDAEKNPRRRPLLTLRPNMDYDANGERFERTPLFRQRRSAGPSSVSTPAIEGGAWTVEQQEALLWFLEHAGCEHETSEDALEMFERLFRELCGAGGLLRDFNCEEIYRMASYMKELLLEEEETDDFKSRLRPREWVGRIPSGH